MEIKQRSLLVFILIILAGLVPIPVYFLEMGNGSLDVNMASLPSRNLTPFEQQVQILAGLVIKPIYMMMSLFIIIALSGQKGTDVSVLQWGQIAFFAGETFCALNFYIYKHESILSEYLHSYGMALAFGFTSFALLEGLETRLLRQSNSKLTLPAPVQEAQVSRAAKSTKGDASAPEARAVARFAIIMLAILTFIPMLSPLQPDAYSVSIFGFPYSYTRFDVYEIYERRVLPALALIAFVISYLPLLRKGRTSIPFLTKVFLCAGLGALSFSFFRVSLNAIFVNNLVWFEFWEEAIELMFVGAIGFVLWKFRATLLEKTPMLENIGFII